MTRTCTDYHDDSYPAELDSPGHWVTPVLAACPDRRCCCTANLCRTADRHGVACEVIVEHGPDVMSVRDCPCTPAPTAAGGGARIP